MTVSTEKLTKDLFTALNAVRDNDEMGEKWLRRHLNIFLSGYPVEVYLYDPGDELKARVDDYIKWCETRSDEDPGELMEEITYLAFSTLKGNNSLKSYRSFSHQLDLVISGSDSDWMSLMEYLHLKKRRRTIVVEAKNWEDKVDDKTFSRLCGILQNIFTNMADLGVFITRNGATGFPKEDSVSSIRPLSEAQATQIIFHARTKKYVIVLTHDDIKKFGQPGALPRILEAKIRAVEEWTGKPPRYNDRWEEVDLPPHLSKYRS